MSPVSTLARRSLKTLAATCGGNRILRGQRPQTSNVLVLAFHRVVSDIVQAEHDACFGLVVSAHTFEQQLRLVQEHYDVVTLDDAAQISQGQKGSARPAAVITFDDGYEDNYKIAWPILQRLGLTATIYLPTAMIGNAKPLDHDRLHWLILLAREHHLPMRNILHAAQLPQAEDVAALVDAEQMIEALVYLPMAQRQRVIERLESVLGGVTYPKDYSLMNWDMVKEMADAGITFGSHTEHHPVLTYETPETIAEEVTRSKQTLEAKLGRPVHHFAYPNGYFNEAVREVVAQAGYLTAVTTQRKALRAGEDLLLCGRFSFCEESTRGITGRFNTAIAKLRLGI